MTLTVTGRHLVVPDPVRADLLRKLAPVERMLGRHLLSAQCVIARQRQSFVCELILHARGDHQLQAVGRDAKLPVAMASAVEKISQQAHKLIGRWKSRKRREAPGLGREASALDAAAPPDGPRVIRARARAIKPMTVEDASLALAQSRDALLVFRQAPSEAVSVLYRRPDGNFGLIELEA
jgi:putative sigma-54 modulation protein